MENNEKNIPNSNQDIKYHKNISIAILLSIFIVGAGQMYNGQILKGIIFIIIYYLIIFLSPIFILIWIYNIYDAYKNAKNINNNNGNYFYNENLKISD